MIDNNNDKSKYLTVFKRFLFIRTDDEVEEVVVEDGEEDDDEVV